MDGHYHQPNPTQALLSSSSSLQPMQGAPGEFIDDERRMQRILAHLEGWWCLMRVEGCGGSISTSWRWSRCVMLPLYNMASDSWSTARRSPGCEIELVRYGERSLEYCSGSEITCLKALCAKAHSLCQTVYSQKVCGGNQTCIVEFGISKGLTYDSGPPSN